MKDNRLRNHIPLGGPATREPVRGDEPALRVSLGFMPSWYYRRLGIDFSQQWHSDPIYRYEALLRMKTHLHSSFPEVPDFAPQYNDRGIEPTCATLSGVFGIKLIPMLYGLGTQYFRDGWPDNTPGACLPKEALWSLEPFDIASLPAIAELERQMDILEETYGAIHGYLNYQGILNNALKLRGNEIFLDMVDDPDFAHHLFAHIADTMQRAAEHVQARQRKSGFEVNLLSVSNCVMNMISPQMYENFVMPLDNMLSRKFARFGVHTCNWTIDPYIGCLSNIEKMGYIDMGMGSDMAKVRRAFPDARRAVLYSPVDLVQKDLGMIDNDLARIQEALAPCDIVMADITADTPDERVRAFLALADRRSKGMK